MDSNATGGATNAGAFVLRNAIKDTAEWLKKQTESEKKDSDKNFRVPDSFFKFIGYDKSSLKRIDFNSDAYYNFLEALLEYCRELFRLENK